MAGVGQPFLPGLAHPRGAAGRPGVVGRGWQGARAGRTGVQRGSEVGRGLTAAARGAGFYLRGIVALWQGGAEEALLGTRRLHGRPLQ